MSDIAVVMVVAMLILWYHMSNWICKITVYVIASFILRKGMKAKK